MRIAGVPDLYQHPTWDRVPVSVRDDLKRWCSGIGNRVQHGRGLILVGDMGTGKSSAAGLVCREAVKAGKTVAWVYVPTMLNEVQDRSLRQSVMNRQLGADLVVWDDFGAKDPAEWDIERLDEIVEARYSRRKSLVVTTNWSKKRMEADRRLGRIMDRWRERMGGLYLVGDSQRRGAGEPVEETGQQSLL
jgi:DNA replication protein DnaC